MRLICPNCGAQYEVDDSVIPDAGRDVQCSNCGHTWFQQPAHKDFETAEELAADAEMADGHSDDPRDETPPEDERQELDPEIASVLREEAERETEARKTEVEGLETQPDLGLDEATETVADRSAAARARMARLRGGEDESIDQDALAAGAAIAAGTSRKELLPDVEEINSSLNSTEDRGLADDDESGYDNDLVEMKEPKKGGRIWFRVILILVLIAIAVYVFAPQIREFIPQSEPYLVAYVDFVNGLRTRIDPLIQSAIDAVKGLIGRFTGGGEDTGV